MGFLSNFLWFSSFTAREKVGSTSMDLFFMHQSRDVRFGLNAPAPIEEIGLEEGPSCQVKWDTGVSPLFSLPLRFARHWRFPFNRISSDFLTDFANCLCVFVRAYLLWLYFASPFLLSRMDTWSGRWSFEFILIRVCMSVSSSHTTSKPFTTRIGHTGGLRETLWYLPRLCFALQSSVPLYWHFFISVPVPFLDSHRTITFQP